VVPLSTGGAYGMSGTALGTDCPRFSPRSSLYLAAENGHIGIVEALLKGGFKVNIQDTVCTYLTPFARPLTVSTNGGGRRMAPTDGVGCVCVWGDRMGRLRFTGRPRTGTSWSRRGCWRPGRT
jgi:hypothetical protein